MKITDDIIYIGVDDTDIKLFESQYSTPDGMCYNSFAIFDDKIAVTDTVDTAFTERWLNNLSAVLGSRKPDFLIVQHMEPDHSAGMAVFLELYPEAKVICTPKTVKMIEQFFQKSYGDKITTVADGEVLSLGRHSLRFIYAPMVHWPEVMMTYDGTDKVLFSADAFGRFGTYNADVCWNDEARRYYIGIVGKYGAQVQSVLKKISSLDIKLIAPLHGPVLSENLNHYISLYDVWSSYKPEQSGVVIAYTSVYGNTEKAVELLKSKLIANGTESVITHNLALCDKSTAVADCFRLDKLILATTTYNGDIFPFMKEFIHALTERGYKNRTVGFIENGTWAPIAANKMKKLLEGCKNLNLCESVVTISSALDGNSTKALERLCEELCEG